MVVDRRAFVVGAAVARVLAGAAFVAAPGLVARAWVGDDARGSGARALAQALGARDALIGVGALLALGGGRPVRPWLQMGAVADAADAAITLARFGKLHPVGRVAVATVAGVSSVAFFRLADSVQ
jgi:hypothetical protein